MSCAVPRRVPKTPPLIRTPQKFSTFVFTPDVEPHLEWLRHVGCQHITHAAVADGIDPLGRQHSTLAGKWPTLLNAAIAAAFVLRQNGTGGDVRRATALLDHCRNICLSGAAAQLHQRRPLAHLEPWELAISEPGKYVTCVLAGVGGSSIPAPEQPAAQLVMPLNAVTLPPDCDSDSDNPGSYRTTATSHRIADMDGCDDGSEAASVLSDDECVGEHPGASAGVAYRVIARQCAIETRAAAARAVRSGDDNNSNLLPAGPTVGYNTPAVNAALDVARHSRPRFASVRSEHKADDLETLHTPFPQPPLQTSTPRGSPLSAWLGSGPPPVFTPPPGRVAIVQLFLPGVYESKVDPWLQLCAAAFADLRAGRRVAQVPPTVIITEEVHRTRVTCSTPLPHITTCNRHRCRSNPSGRAAGSLTAPTDGTASSRNRPMAIRSSMATASWIARHFGAWPRRSVAAT